MPTRTSWHALGFRPFTAILLVVLLGVVVATRSTVAAHLALVPSGFHVCLAKRGDVAKITCQERAMKRAIGDSTDPFPALARFDDAMTTTRNDSACHRAGHGVGRSYGRGLEDAGELVAASMSKFDEQHNICTLGFLHGIAEVSVTGDADQFRRLSQLSCAPLDDRPMRGFCFHGLGHGLVLAKLSLETAHARCKLLDVGDAGSCDDGVRMQVEIDQSKRNDA